MRRNAKRTMSTDEERRPAKRARNHSSWRPFEDFVDSRGHPHALAVRRNVLKMKGSVQSVAKARGVCPQSVRDFRALLQHGGDLQPLPRSGGPSFKLSADDAYALYLYTVLVTDASREECCCFLLVFRHVAVSESTISKEWKRLGISRKMMKYYSMVRDEPSRIAWWVKTNDLSKPRHERGVAGVKHSCIVDVDEAIFYWDRVNRRFGHAPIGQPAKMAGIARHGGDRCAIARLCADGFVHSRHLAPIPPPRFCRYQVVVACDQLKGVFAVFVFEGHIDTDLFHSFFALVVLPRISGTGRRFIMLDNASWHNEDKLRIAAADEGHDLAFRPVHSPDFGPVEWTISHAESTLKRNKQHITRENYARWIECAFRSIGPALVQSFFADAHYVVPGYQHKPYFGQQ